MKDDGSKIEKRNTNNKPDEISYTEDIIKPDYFLVVNLQEGFTRDATLEIQRGFDKNKEMNFEEREFEKADAITFFENFKDCRKNKEYEINLSDQS